MLGANVILLFGFALLGFTLTPESSQTAVIGKMLGLGLPRLFLAIGPAEDGAALLFLDRSSR